MIANYFCYSKYSYTYVDINSDDNKYKCIKYIKILSNQSLFQKIIPDLLTLANFWWFCLM